MTAEYKGSGAIVPRASLARGDRVVKGSTPNEAKEAKKANERLFGDILVDELNRRTGTCLLFVKHETPDLVYQDDREPLNIEVTCAYYDNDFAKIIIGHIRGFPGPSGIYRMKPDDSLQRAIETRIGAKSKNRYGRCVLLIGVHAQMTTPAALEALLLQLTLPESNPFSKIYVVAICADGNSGGGRYVWQLGPPERLAP